MNPTPTHRHPALSSMPQSHRPQPRGQKSQHRCHQLPQKLFHRPPFLPESASPANRASLGPQEPCSGGQVRKGASEFPEQERTFLYRDHLRPGSLRGERALCSLPGAQAPGGAQRLEVAAGVVGNQLQRGSECPRSLGRRRCEPNYLTLVTTVPPHLRPGFQEIFLCVHACTGLITFENLFLFLISYHFVS